MTTAIYLNFRNNLGKKLESLAADTLKVALFTSSYLPSATTDCAYLVNAPAAPTLTQAAGGTLAARTEYYKTTFVNPAGESLASAEANIAASANNVVTVTAPSNPGASCTGYNVYASTTSGSETLQNSSPITFGTNWIEPVGGLTTSGASPPASNTAQISGEVAAGNGYTRGGLTLSGVSWGGVAANSWPDSWTSSTAYSLGQIVRPASTNGFLYLCVAVGVSGGTAPSWGATVGALTTDGTAVWMNIGAGLSALTAANLSWTVTGVVAFRYIVIYDASTGDLVGYIDPGVNQTSSNSGYINVNWDSAGILVF